MHFTSGKPARYTLRLSCIYLTQASRDYILRHFGKLITNEKLDDFISIPFEEILSSDHLNVYEEEQVFEAIIHWTKGSPKDRLSHIGIDRANNEIEGRI